MGAWASFRRCLNLLVIRNWSRPVYREGLEAIAGTAGFSRHPGQPGFVLPRQESGRPLSAFTMVAMMGFQPNRVHSASGASLSSQATRRHRAVT